VSDSDSKRPLYDILIDDQRNDQQQNQVPVCIDFNLCRQLVCNDTPTRFQYFGTVDKVVREYEYPQEKARQYPREASIVEGVRFLAYGNFVLVRVVSNPNRRSNPYGLHCPHCDVAHVPFLSLLPNYLFCPNFLSLSQIINAP
jgi:hypothetical protein